MALLAVGLNGQQPPQEPQSGQESFRFKSGVELINVTATVTDASGRFVPNLRQEDFVVYEDDERRQRDASDTKRTNEGTHDRHSFA